MTILLAEDDESIAAVVTIVLSESGHEVLVASDKKSFHDNLLKIPQLILLDLSLNGTKGDVLAGELKKDPLYADIPLIMVSANNDTKKIAEKCGADGFLLKPFDLDELDLIVSKYLP